ncbi:urease accessory protein [Ideonella sp. DXS29W]|uniref:Urease accessory protein n=1 Tax=Ideonella lacteola TaxID=2984193 RepID=A0ABU9BSK3_9BURK
MTALPTLLPTLLVGLLLGVQHATEADHLAAVATLATREGGWRQAMRQGAFWGLGHTLTLLTFAGAVLVLGQVIPPQVERGLESAVGVMLVLLGADVLRRVWRPQTHLHVHRHGTHGRPELVHLHIHGHAPALHTTATSPEHAHAEAGGWPLRALAVGMMHGLAGSAALSLMSLQAAPALSLGLSYIALFGLGSIAGMALLSAALVAPMRLTARHLVPLQRWLQAGVGAFSCGLGAFTIVQMSG